MDRVLSDREDPGRTSPGAPIFLPHLASRPLRFDVEFVAPRPPTSVDARRASGHEAPRGSQPRTVL